MAAINVNAILEMLFLTLNNAIIVFANQELTWRSYIPAKVLLTTKQVDIINKKKYAKAALNKNIKTFVVYMAYKSAKMSIYSAQKAQIALLVAEKVIIAAEYLDFIDVFLKKTAVELPKRSGINNHVINLEPGK